MENQSFMQRLLSVFRSGPTDKDIAAQLRKPSGKMALKVANKMNESNAGLYNFVLDHMDILNSQVIMEIGCANGKFLEKIHAKARDVQVYGLDYSPEMFAEAKRLNRQKLDAGGLGLYLGSSEAIPLASGIVDQAFCINVVYFWEAPVDHLREIHRVLKPGGRFAISDIVTDGDVPPAMREDATAWAGCLGGALDREEYLSIMRAAGLVVDEVQAAPWGDSDRSAGYRFVSATVVGRKP